MINNHTIYTHIEDLKESCIKFGMDAYDFYDMYAIDTVLDNLRTIWSAVEMEFSNQGYDEN